MSSNRPNSLVCLHKLHTKKLKLEMKPWFDNKLNTQQTFYCGDSQSESLSSKSESYSSNYNKNHDD